METQRTVDLELLCAQAPWLRALARHLVRDPAAAEDIAQETLLAALEAPPADVADPRRLRAWLRRVAYNLSHLARRRGMRRRAREERVARSDFQASTAETVLVNSVKRHVVDAVGSLDEPYRSTVELRYFEGASTADIAVRMGTTDNAVRKRLYRARRKLRQRLDTVHQGDRRAWFDALLPLAQLPAPSPLAPRVGAQTAKLSPLALGAAGLAAVGALLVVPLQATGPRGLELPPQVARTALADTPATLAPGSQRQLVGGSSARRMTPGTLETQLAEPPPPATEPIGDPHAADSAPGALPPLPVAGRVVDLSGAPLAGLAIHAGNGGEALAWSDPRGRFDLALDVETLDAKAEVRLRAAGNDFATLQEALVRPQSAGRELLIVAARAVNVSGQVVDEDGLPLAGTEVRLEADERAFLALENDLAGTLLARATTRTDEHGIFALRSLPSGIGIELCAEVTGTSAELFEGPLRVPVPAHDAHDLRLTLARAAPPPLVLRGTVRFEDGEPAPQTLVRLGGLSTHADAHGAFTFRLRRLSPGLDLIAERPGYRQIHFPQLSTLMRSNEALTLRRDPCVSLVLVESQSELAGRVRDASGQPCAGWIVHARASEDSATGHAAGPAEARTATTFTDETGRFLLAGLFDRPHDIVAYDASTLLSVRSTEIAAGRTDVTLELPVQDTLLESVSGRVTDEAGIPIAGADVRLALALTAVDAMHGGELHAFRRATKTDALGYFELFDVPRHSVEIAVRAAGAELHRALDHESAQELTIRMPRSIGVRIKTVLADASTFAVVDAAGNALPLHGASREPRARGRLHAGQSILYSTSSAEAAGVIVFDGNDDEIRRMTLDAFKRPLRR